MSRLSSYITASESAYTQRIDAERINLIFKQFPISNTGAFICAIALVYLLRHLIDTRILISWFTIWVLTTCLRSALVWHYHRAIVTPVQVKRWVRWHLIGTGFTGLLWGSTAVIMFPAQSPVYQMILILILCCIVVATATIYAIMVRGFITFSLPALAPLVIRLFSIPDEIHLILGALVMLFWIVMALVARNISRTRTQLLKLKKSLADEVGIRTQELKQANTKLRKEIQERAHIEDRLRQQRDHLETITGNIGAGLAVISHDFRTLWANRVLKDIFGEVEDKPCYVTHFQKKKVCKNCGVRLVFEKGVEKAIHEQKGRDANGNIICSQIITTPIKNKNGETIAALELVLPITEQKKAAEEKRRMTNQLEQARKVESIATLAGGIAHQFNNALSVIVGNIEVLELDFRHDSRLSNYLNPILKSAHQMARLTSQLLAYAEGGKYKPQLVEIENFFNTTLPLVRHAIKPTVRINTSMDTKGAKINVDPTQMQMVISAILANASEAITKQGEISINCHIVSYSTTKDIPAGDYVQIAIHDDGEGMDTETLERIFEPFFTTKFQGRGLGMAAVFGIIKNHGGHIRVLSQRRQGTQVSIYLPVIWDEVQHSVALEHEPVRGSGMVLLIEDEELVLDINRMILNRLGYQVIVARNGHQAIEIIKDIKTNIDLVLLDIKLPDTDGSTIYPVIRQYRPSVKVLICSGYTFDGPTQALIDAGADGFIQKPFSLNVLAAKLNKIMISSEDSA